MAESKVAMPETEEKAAVAEPQTKSPVRIVVAILLVIAIGAGLWAYYHYRDASQPTTRKWTGTSAPSHPRSAAT